jgi:hypothetical protein
MTTATTTRQISPRTAIRAYKATTRRIATLRTTLADPGAMRADYREITEQAMTEQLNIWAGLLEHPALAAMSEDELEALSA